MVLCTCKTLPNWASRSDSAEAYELLEVRLDVVPALVSSLTRHAPCAHCQRAAISAFADDAADASRVPVLAMAAQVVFHGGELDSTLSVAFAHMPNNP